MSYKKCRIHAHYSIVMTTHAFNLDQSFLQRRQIFTLTSGKNQIRGV